MNDMIQVNTEIKANEIRRETYNGREHIIVPSYTLPFNVVMNREFYPQAEIVANYKSLEGTLAPLGHPKVNGEHVSAMTPEGLNTCFAGAWNRNVELRGNRVYCEKWIDVETAKQSAAGRELLERVEALEAGDTTAPIWSSVAVYRQQLPADDAMKAAGADYVVKISSIDHDAILLHEPPAATPDQGVGLMVNTADAEQLKTYTAEMSYRAREAALYNAALELFPNQNIYVVDFTGDSVTIATNDGKTHIYPYQNKNDNICINNENVVHNENKVSWFDNLKSHIKALLNFQTSIQTNEEDTDNPPEDLDMPMTAEERAELLKDLGAVIKENIDTAIAPVNTAIEELKTNAADMQAKIAANADKELVLKRAAIAKVHGEMIANSLADDKVEEVFKGLGEAQQIAANNAQEEQKAEIPDPAKYF